MIFCVAILAFVLGILTGCIFFETVLCETIFKDGTLNIDTSNPEKDCYLFMISKPLDSLPKKKHIHLRIARTTKDSQIKQPL